jgi:hypothetical protein
MCGQDQFQQGRYCQFNVLHRKRDIFAKRWHHFLCTCHVLPNLEHLRTQEPIVDRLHQVAAKSKQVLRQAMECEKPLRLSRRGKPTHVTFSLARRFVRDFGAVIRIDVVDVIDRGHDRPMSRIITSKFIGDQPAWLPALAFEKTAEKAFSRTLIATALHENINAIAVLIHGTPQILALPLNGDKDFVYMPRIAQAALPFFEFARMVRPKLLTPLPNRFIRDGDPTFGEEFFDFTKAEAEPMVEPHCVADNFIGKPVALVAGCCLFHAAQSAKPELN